MCTAAGIAAPEFEEITGAAVVTFRVPVAGSARSTGEVTGVVTGEVARVLAVLTGEPMARKDLQATLGLHHEDHFRRAYLVPAIEMGFVEMTVPDKPNSRLQKYRLTAAGRTALATVSVTMGAPKSGSP